MLFQTTSAHEELRAKIRSFAEEEIKPLAFLMDQNNEFPEEAVKKLGKLGWMGIPYPKEYGGAGLDALSYAIAVEELARVDGGTGVILSAHVSLGSWPIFAYGTEEQKKKYLVPLAKGEKIGAFGLTETNAGSDAGGTETTALDKGDYYLLNGGKIFITNAPKADTYVVFAVTTPDIGTRGISAFIVEKGWKGFEFGDHYDKMGIRSSSTAELIFNNVKVPKENLLGKEGEGFKIAMSTLDGGRIGIAAQALGIAQGAFEQALSYSKDTVKERSARLVVHGVAQRGDWGGLFRMVIEQHIRPMQADIVQFPVLLQLFPQRRGQMVQHICAKAAVCVGRGHFSFLLLAVPAPAALFRLH